MSLTDPTPTPTLSAMISLSQDWRGWALLTGVLVCLLGSPRAALALEPAELTARVGHEIDSLERDYFGLFPRVEGFVSAKMFRLSDGSMQAHVRLTRQNSVVDSVIIFGEHSAQRLADYVDRYEVTRSEGVYTHNHVYILASRTNYFRSELQSLIYSFRDGQETDGVILWASADSLILLRNASTYDWNNSQRFSERIAINDLAEIKYDRQPNKSLWVGLGFVGGSIAGALAVGAASDDDEKLSPTGAILGGLGAAVISYAIAHKRTGWRPLVEFSIDEDPGDFLTVLKANSLCVDDRPIELR